jgi:phosphoglycerate dehydrogenase-like enzyme
MMNINNFKGENDMKVLFTLIPPEDLRNELKKEFPDCAFYFQKGIKVEDSILQEAEVIVTYGEDLNEEIIELAEKLRWIMVVSAGLEKMPLQMIGQRGILVTNARGIHKIPMAEYTMGMLLQYEKRFRRMWENQKKAIWDRRLNMGELYNKEILIMGVGAIGGEIARLAKAFGMTTVGINKTGNKVDYVDKLHSFDDLNKLLPTADYIVSILPSTADTKHLLQYSHFEIMKNSAVFMNIGRGDLVEEEVLLKALKNNEIAHAILDVFHEEPLPKNHPYWGMDQITISPHTSSVTKKYLPRSLEIFKDNLHTYVNKGETYINKIDVTRGY